MSEERVQGPQQLNALTWRLDPVSGESGEIGTSKRQGHLNGGRCGGGRQEQEEGDSRRGGSGAPSQWKHVTYLLLKRRA